MVPQFLQGKVALVTGAGSGIGGGVSLSFASSGAKVTDIDGDSARGVSQEIEDAGGHALPIELDVTDRWKVRSAVSATVETYSKIDILVNCAGIVHREELRTQSDEAWKRMST